MGAVFPIARTLLDIADGRPVRQRRIEIPDAMFRQIKSLAAERGISLKRFVSDALDLAAWDCLDRDPRTLWLPIPETAHELHFRRLVAARQPSPHLWTNVWLAALAESSAVGLTSFDSGFRSFQLRDFELLKA